MTGHALHAAMRPGLIKLTVPRELLATGCFLTVLPSFMLRVPRQNPPLKALPVALPNSRKPVGLITLKYRTTTPLAKLFIDNVRPLATTAAS